VALLTNVPSSFANVQVGLLTATSATAALLTITTDSSPKALETFLLAEIPEEALFEILLERLADAEEGALTVVVSVVSPLVLVVVPLEELGATPELPQPTT